MNIILDPLLIHGYWIFPKMGIKGAAIATIISRACGMVATLSFAHFHHKLLSFKYESAKELIDSWKGILKIGLPSTTVQLMPPASAQHIHHTRGLGRGNGRSRRHCGGHKGGKLL